MPCTLSAYSPDFDVDRFLKRSKLKTDRVWHKGVPQLPRSQPDGARPKTSGLSIEIGDQDEIENLRPQVLAAVEFLSANRRELRRLGKVVGEKWFALTFGIRWRNDVALFADGIPPELSRLAGDVGCWISISHYWMDETGRPRPKSASLKTTRRRIGLRTPDA